MADLLDLLEVITAAPTTAPQGFTTDPQWSLADLEDAYAALRARARVELEGGASGIARWSHCWSRGWRASRPAGAHPIEVVTAELRCDHYGQDCQCVGDMVYRAWCWDCEHWSVIATCERTAVEDIHDHCWPGWRDLPVGPTADREAHWEQAGAPILTERGPVGTRPVPGRNPFGGYALPAPTV